jgi:hypothetical protein
MTQRQKFGGRRKGTPNKTTRAARDVFAELLDANRGKVQALFDRIAERQPAKALELYVKVAEFVMPKVMRVEATVERAPDRSAELREALHAATDVRDAATLYALLVSGAEPPPGSKLLPARSPSMPAALPTPDPAPALLLEAAMPAAVPAPVHASERPPAPLTAPATAAPAAEVSEKPDRPPPAPITPDAPEALPAPAPGLPPGRHIVDGKILIVPPGTGLKVGV